VSIFDVQHQSRAQRILQRALSGGRLPHAYIFHGPDGVGKEMLADRFARLLLCAEPRSVPAPAEQAGHTAARPWRDACGQCQDCRLAQAGTHPDYHLITRELLRHHPDPEARRRKAIELSVEVVRYFLIEPAGATPARGRAKVFVVRQAERATDSAQNALLKTLEEPPERTFLILLTSSLERLLPTTRSRCQLVPFSPLPADFVQAELRRLRPEIDPPAAEFLARYADGQLGRALELFDDGLLELRRGLLDRLLELARDEGASQALAAELSSAAKTLAETLRERDPDLAPTDALRAGLRTLLAAAASLYRDVLQVAFGRAKAVVNADQRARLRALCEVTTPAAASAAIRQILAAEIQIARHANVELVLDVLATRLARAARPQGPA